jgi:mannose-6-phosphate isomerase-like protein (cupin superfamily)
VTIALKNVLGVEELKRTPSGPVEGFDLSHEGREAAPFRASRWILEPGLTTDWDQHDVLEMWIVSAGHGVVLRDDYETAVVPGDAVLMPSRVRHRLFNAGNETMRVVSIWWAAE